MNQVIHGVKHNCYLSYTLSGSLNMDDFNLDFWKYYRFFTTKSALFRTKVGSTSLSLSLVPRPTWFFDLQFVFTVVHRSGKAVKNSSCEGMMN